MNGLRHTQVDLVGLWGESPGKDVDTAFCRAIIAYPAPAQRPFRAVITMQRRLFVFLSDFKASASSCHQLVINAFIASDGSA